MAGRSFCPFASLFQSRTTSHHPTLSSTDDGKEESDTDDGKEESSTNILSHLDLDGESVDFIMKHGETFLDYPDGLAERLSINVSVAKEALDILKAYMISQISNEEIEEFEMLLEENSERSLRQIALSHGINVYVVPAYLAHSETIPLTESEKLAIKEHLDAGSPITKIAEDLRTSQKKIKEYVEKKFILFTGKDGEAVLAIISKHFGRDPIVKLREMIAKNDMSLQEKICFELLERNEREHEAVKDYFMKFEESQNFFEFTESLSIEAKTCIRASSIENTKELSVKLNIMERVIIKYFLQYFPDEQLMLDCAQDQFTRIQSIKEHFLTDMLISHTTYRMIISDSSETLIQNAKNLSESPKRVFDELLPLAFYYLKCSLPLEEITRILAKITKISLTTLDIFHLIFQMSDPVVRGLCIEHYSFSNPVPFYYPILGPYPPEKTSCKFETCKELWYSLQEFSGLVSFGLGWASWNPIGKSHLLDLMFETDFVKGSPQNSPFHLGSIDIQMTKNLFGQRVADESTQWAYIDCHRYSDIEVIWEICKNLDIALIHVSYSDYRENYSFLVENLNKITVKIKHIYVLFRDYTINEVITERVTLDRNDATFIFIPNLIDRDEILFVDLREIGYKILHSKDTSSRSVGSKFLENMITRYGCWENMRIEKGLIEGVMNNFHTSTNIQNKIEVDFSSLSYYPPFIEYMRCYYEASTRQTDQKIIDELNEKCKYLAKHLEDAEISAIAWQFNEILAQENSTLILWKLFQELRILSKQLIAGSNETPFTLELLWREALLSNKYNLNLDEEKPVSKYFETFSSNFSNHVERGEPFELIDGDNLRFFNKDINVLLSKFYEKQLYQNTRITSKQRPPIVVSIFGPQSSGKSTLLNYCFGCKFLTSAGRCTKGIYASLSKLSQPINDSDHFLILDTEGLDAIERGNTIQDTSCINFDRTMVLFCLAVSQVVIINVKGDLGEEMRNLLQICAYSLNKLKVSKVAAPKIFFVLNQQADPSPAKHLHSINILLEKLNKESDLIETEGLKISNLIGVSEENLFVLPSAFNSESLNTQMTKLFDSDLCKSFPTFSFANKCSSLRISIINQLKNEGRTSKTNSNNMTHNYKMPINTMSEWMEMSGVIWDTIVKYQDIVKYRNTDELRCSKKISEVLNNLMQEKIYSKREEYRKITEKLILLIKEYSKWSNQSGILEEVKKDLDEAFENYQEIALKGFAAQCKSDSLLRKMDYMCDEAKSNLCRLIYMEKKIYEDKLKLEIKARLTEIKLTENMNKFQQGIEKNADRYFELTIEEQTIKFEKIWPKCFGGENRDEEDDELEEKFDNLYSVFRMESKTMENKPTINTLFRNMQFEMDKIIEFVSKEMLSKFCTRIYNFSETNQFIYPWKENRVPLKEMTPYLGQSKFEYLSTDSLYIMETQASKPDLKFRKFVPSDCYSLLKYCSGYYNHPDIVWMVDKRNQILLLASELKDPNNFERSTWHKFINDISKHVQEFIQKDPSISHSTVKKIVDFLCRICRVVNYEINFIEAKLTNTAERTISTYAFAFAFKSLLEAKKVKQRGDKLNKYQTKERDLQYFLQKVENIKLARGNWDRSKMREGDQIMANKFARDFLAVVCRGVSIECKQNMTEKYFNMHRVKLSYNGILLLAKEKVKKEFSYYNPIDQSNFVVQFICNQTQTLKTLFQEEWLRLAIRFHDEIIGDMQRSFIRQVSTVLYVLMEFLEGLTAMCKKSKRPEDIGLDADSNFEVADNPSTKVFAGNSDSNAKLFPYKTMVLYLKMYLDPNISPDKFNQFFSDVFKVDGVNMKKHPNYVLFGKPHIPAQKLIEPTVDNELYKVLSDTNMFKSIETIFNIKEYVEAFCLELSGYKYQVTEDEYDNILKATQEQFEAHIINCPSKCPSCGKLCEKEIHSQEGKCQILTGHQICSMGGNVWNTDKNRTAILLMCEDYEEDSPVLIPGQNMKWWEFKEKCGDQWDWTLPTDEKYVTLQKRNRKQTIEIWNKYGEEILKYYANSGTHITYIPYTSLEEICESLIDLKYYICFVIDGTNLMGGTLAYIKKWVLDIMKDSQFKDPSNFKVIVYHGNHSPDCIEKFPNDSEFTSDDKSIENFLMNITSCGDEKNEFAMLHGLATAAKESDWKSGFGIKNIVVHFYVEPTDGDFDIFTAKGKCDKGCQFDWERDISDRMHKMKILYKSKTLIHSTHPKYGSVEVTPVDDQTTGVNMDSHFKTQIFINYKTDN